MYANYGGGFQQPFVRPDYNNNNYNSNTEVQQNFQKLELEDQQNDETNEKTILDTIIFYFSIENLNKDYFY